ncbi:MAG: ABC transporter permease [Bacilli bacterium]
MFNFEENNKETLSTISVNKDDFVLVQDNVKISDKKFDSKPTTFIKDAFRRFKKNKSSVAGAIILGILIVLTLLVPVASDKDIKTVKVKERFLAPKLFPAGTGFWDGTRKIKNVIYDIDNEVPAGYYKPACSKIKIDEEYTLINAASAYAKDGYVHLLNEKVENSEDLSTKVLYTYNKTKFNATSQYKVEMELGDIQTFDYEFGEYRITLRYNQNTETKEYDELVLKDWSKEYGVQTIDISKAIQDASLSIVNDANFVFELKPVENKTSYLLIKSLKFSCAEGMSNEELLGKLSFDNASEMVLRMQDEETKQFPEGYWQSTGVKSVYGAKVKYCSFTYDTYAAAYDEKEVTLAKSELDVYINNGWCSYDYSSPENFVILDEDKCPISGIISQKTNSITGKVLSVTATAYRYKDYGYKSMPIFLMGTDAQGHDLFKKAFSGLRTSLVLGVCTAAFCFLFGLVFGAIEGYFGGNVDIIMERFCDILSGVPWIVVMTLCILHLGNNFMTFFLALCMTGWMGTAARTRTQFYRFKGREYVLASRTLGASDARLIAKHILPNSLGTIITSSVLMVPSVIFSEANLAYLRLGLQGVDSFGVLLSENQAYLAIYPNLIVFPSIIMALIMISFNLFGNGLRDALNPSLKGSD